MKITETARKGQLMAQRCSHAGFSRQWEPHWNAARHRDVSPNQLVIELAIDARTAPRDGTFHLLRSAMFAIARDMEKAGRDRQIQSPDFLDSCRIAQQEPAGSQTGTTNNLANAKRTARLGASSVTAAMSVGEGIPAR